MAKPLSSCARVVSSYALTLHWRMLVVPCCVPAKGTIMQTFVMLLALFVLCVAARADSIGGLDPRFGQGGTVLRQNGGGISVKPGDKYTVAAADGDTLTVVITPAGTVIEKLNSNGARVTTFGTNGGVLIPYDTGKIQVYGGRLWVMGVSQNSSTSTQIDTVTGKQLSTFNDLILPSVPNSLETLAFLANLLATDATKAVSAGVGPYAIVGVLEQLFSPTQCTSSLVMVDLGAGALVTTFGTNGRAVIPGNFCMSWGVRTSNGIVVGGQTIPANNGRPGQGVANFDLKGRPGTCGSGVKEVLPGSSAFSLPTTSGAFYAPGLDLVTFVGAAPTALFSRQLKSDCTLTTTTFSYPKPVFTSDAALVGGDTMAVAITEFNNSVPSARVALYSMSAGGTPIAVTPLLTTGTTVSSADTGHITKAATITSSQATSLSIQPDAGIMVGGTTDAVGGSAFVARFVGVETTTKVTEFFNTTLNHYFITADPNEAAAIDAGAAGPGWSRTGQTWKSGGPARVCRFYGVQASGGPNGHFYTIDTDECSAVKRDPGWHFESYDFSGSPLTGGVCPAGTLPIKRVYNGRFAQHDSNHRYTTSDAIYASMIAAGWSGEGVVFCSGKP